MSISRYLFIGLFVLLSQWALTGALQAQPEAPETPSPLLTSAYQDILIRAGPGHTHREVGFLRAGIPVVIVERNSVGTWVRVIRFGDQDNVLLDGWVNSGFLLRDDALRFSDVQRNTELPDADPSNADYVVTALLYEAAIISEINPAMLQVYEHGQDRGNRPGVVTKVGDSLSANPLYLLPFSQEDYQLGPYDYLEDSVRYFGPRLVENSVASRIGMTTLVVFDPLWADKERCLPNETPLSCEYRLSRPSFAMVMFGPNDVRHMTDAEFNVQMRRLVEESLNAGVIPILTTFSVHPEDNLWWQAINFNLHLKDINEEYGVPLINLWAAARTLPEYGLDIDRIHLKNGGFEYIRFSGVQEASYGVPLLNLLSIHMLDDLRHALPLDEED